MAQAGSSDYCDSLTYDFNVRLRDITQARGLNHTKVHCTALQFSKEDAHEICKHLSSNFKPKLEIGKACELLSIRLGNYLAQ